MDFVKFSSTTCTVFPVANTVSGGQLVTEYNLRSRESVSTNPEITYTSYPSYTHDKNDFSISRGSNAHTISIAAGQCVLNGHYFESLAPIDIDMQLANGTRDTEDLLTGNLKIGLRAFYSTDTTMSGSLIAEDSNYMLEGIRVVILPENNFITPDDSPDDESAVTAHLLLGSFRYSIENGVSNIKQNNSKFYSIPAERISDLGDALDGKYLTGDPIYPSGIFTMEGRGSSDGSITSQPTWSNSTNSLMLWDNSTETTTNKPTLQAAQFNTFPMGDNTYTILQIPHKQIDGYFEAYVVNGETKYRRLYFPTKNLTLPLADFDRGTAGTVDRSYTNKIKNLAKKFDTIYLLPNGKQRAFIEEISSLEDRPKMLPPINGSWNYGDYVLVRNDLSVDWATDGDSTISTMYVVLGPYVSDIEYVGEVYQSDSLEVYETDKQTVLDNNGLTGTEINYAGIDTTATLINSQADFAEMYYTNSIAFLENKKTNGKYTLHSVASSYSDPDVSYFPDVAIVGSVATDNIDTTTRTLRFNSLGVGEIVNNTPFVIRQDSRYTLKYSTDGGSTFTTLTADTHVDPPDVYTEDYIEFTDGSYVWKVSGGETIHFETTKTSLNNQSVEIKMYYSHSAVDIASRLKVLYLAEQGIDSYDVYVYTGDANVGEGGYIKRCSAVYCPEIADTSVSENDKYIAITKVIDEYISNNYQSKIPLTDTNGNYVYRLSTKVTGNTIIDYMELTYAFTSGNTGQVKYLTQIFKIPYPSGVFGKSGYSEPIIITGNVFLATTDMVGGFYNIDVSNESYADNGYIYLDSEGHLRLYDYELLRSAELAYILNTDKVLGDGMTYEELQSQLNDEVNNRVAFPTAYTATTEMNQFTVTITLVLSKSDTEQTILIDNIDQRYGTAVILNIRGEADENTTLRIVNCNKIKINPNISGNPNIEVYNSGVCYDASVFNTVSKFQNISLWYEKFSESDPNLVVNGMTVTDLDVASFILGQDTSLTTYLNTAPETVQYDLTFGDYNFTYGLRSITMSSDGYVSEVGIYVKNQSSTRSSIAISADTGHTSKLYLAKFKLPQSVNLQYPITKIGANIRIDGSFISGYETTDNDKYLLATNSFAAMVNKFDISSVSSFEEYSGVYYAIGTISYRIDTDVYEAPDIAVDSDVILSTGVSGAMDAVLQSFDNNTYHVFEGYSIPVIGQG